MIPLWLPIIVQSLLLLADEPFRENDPPQRTVAWEDLSLRLRAGEIIAYRVSDAQTFHDQAPGSPVIESQVISTLTLQPTETTPQGFRLRAQYERVKGKMIQGKARTLFDTLDEPARQETVPISMYREWIGRPMDVEIDSSGAVISIEPTPSTPPTAPTASTTAAVAQLRRHLVLLWSWIPRGPHGNELRWERQETLATGLVDLTRHNTLMVVDVDGPTVQIEGTLRITGKPTRNAGPEGETVIASIDATEPGRAKIAFDSQAGHVLRIESAIDMVMNVTRVAAADATNSPIDKAPANKQAVQSAQKLEARTLVEFLSRSAIPAAN